MDDIVTRLRELDRLSQADQPFRYVKDIFGTAAAEIGRLMLERDAMVDEHNRALAMIGRFYAAATEFLAAEDAVEVEAKRAEANGGLGWSSAPVARRMYAIQALREALPTTLAHEQTEDADGGRNG